MSDPIESFVVRGGRITITMTFDRYNAVMLMFGYAIGAALKAKDKHLANNFVRLVNKLNRGNPRYVPYRVGGEPSDKPFQVRA